MFCAQLQFSLLLFLTFIPSLSPSLWFRGLTRIEDIITFITKIHLKAPLCTLLPFSYDFWTLLQITALLCDCFNHLK